MADQLTDPDQIRDAVRERYAVEADCCDSAAQESCCEPADKSACCDSHATAGGSCSCQSA